MASDAAIAALKSGLRGALIQAGDTNYNEARKIYNAWHDKRPRLIAEVADVADVITCVNFARAEKMIVAIQGGGHNAGGLGTVDDGLVIKLSRMKSTRVDPYEITTDGRVLLSRGSVLVHTSHLHPIIGTPALVPVPRNSSSTSDIAGVYSRHTIADQSGSPIGISRGRELHPMNEMSWRFTSC